MPIRGKGYNSRSTSCTWDLANIGQTNWMHLHHLGHDWGDLKFMPQLNGMNWQMLQVVNLGRRVVGCTCRNPAKLIMFILWDLPQNGDIMTSMGCACMPRNRNILHRRRSEFKKAERPRDLGWKPCKTCCIPIYVQAQGKSMLTCWHY